MVVFAVRRLALDAAGEAALAEAPSNPRDCTGGHFQCFSRTGIRPSRAFRSLIHLQQYANARLLGRRTLPESEAFEEARALLFS
jgi:hypothetical protein